MEDKKRTQTNLRLKTKFYNIPKDQRTAIRMRAREYLLSCKANHQAQPDKFHIGTFGKLCVYTFDSAQLVFSMHEGKLKEIDFVYQEGKSKQVSIDVTREHWTRKLFFDLMKAKNVVTNGA